MFNELMAELTAVARHVRTDILRFLAENPHPRSKGSHWSGYAIAKKMGLGESTVWKVTTRFRECECGVLEPEEPTLLQKPEAILRDLDGRPAGKKKRTTATFRGEIACRLSGKGKRLAELMQKLEDERLIPTGFRTDSLTGDAEFLARIAPFTADDIEAAKRCDLIEETRPRGYSYHVGVSIAPTESSILGGGVQVEITGYLYRIK